MSRNQGFQPHRVHPRFGPVFDAASRVHLGVPALLAVLGRLVLDQQKSTSSYEVLAQSLPRFAICGFPRTGTTYLSHALDIALSVRRPLLKTHDAMAPSVLDRYGVETLLTLRDPSSTVASWSCYHGDVPSIDLVRHRLATFTAWHRIVLRAMPRYRISVLPFEYFTHDTASAVNQFLAAKVPAESFAPVDFKSAARLIEEETDQESLTLNQRNLPSDDRSRQQSKYSELLESAELAAPLRRARQLVQEIHSHSGVTQGLLVG